MAFSVMDGSIDYDAIIKNSLTNTCGLSTGLALNSGGSGFGTSSLGRHLRMPGYSFTAEESSGQNSIMYARGDCHSGTEAVSISFAFYS